MPPTAPKPNWRKSKAKQLVAQDMIDGIVPVDQPIKDPERLYNEMYADHEYFQDFPFDKKKFTGYFERLRKSVKLLGDSAKYDKEALEHDLMLYPPQTHGPTGKLLFRDSECDRWLEIDIDNGIDKTMTLTAFQNSRDCYKLFERERFRKRIDQKHQDRKAWGRKPPGQMGKGDHVQGAPEDSRRDELNPYVNN